MHSRALNDLISELKSVDESMRLQQEENDQLQKAIEGVYEAWFDGNLKEIGIALWMFLPAEVFESLRRRGLERLENGRHH